MTLFAPAKALAEKCKYFLRHSHRSASGIIFAGLMLDNLLLTVVVPILPNVIYQLDHPEQFAAPNNGCTKADLTVCPMPAAKSMVANNKHANTLDLMNENAKLGILFSSKAFVQLMVNPFTGMAAARYGYTVPLFFGFCVLFISAILFAVGSTYGALFFARSLQGVGSSGIVISGMGLISSYYPNDVDRSRQMGVALSGIAAGVLVGYPFGSVMYEYGGKSVPFVLISLFVLVLGGIQFLVLPPKPEYSAATFSTSTKTLLRDPYISTVILTISVSTCAMATLEPCLPLWLMETMNPEPWELGTAFVPDSVGYFIGSSFFGVFALRIGRWKCGAVAMVIVGISAICIPFARAVWHLILPHFGLGIGIGIVDASFMPLLALLVDLRHDAMYGSVFAVAQIAVCLAYSMGPLIGGLVANAAGFPFLMRTIGIANILVSPACLYLRHIPYHPENLGLLNHQANLGPNGSRRSSAMHQLRRPSGMYHTLLVAGDDASSPIEGPGNKFSSRRKSSVRRF